MGTNYRKELSNSNILPKKYLNSKILPINNSVNLREIFFGSHIVFKEEMSKHEP
jgi:hypothetical protein